MATHESFHQDEEFQVSSDRSFGFVFAAVFAVLGLFPLLKGGQVRLWALGVSAFFLLAALAVPSMLHGANVLWMKFALLLSKVTNPIITGLMFYALFTPIAFFVRLTGKDLLRLQHDRDASSYWIVREPPGPAPGTMRNQF
jgi:hypothetical protein